MRSLNYVYIHDADTKESLLEEIANEIHGITEKIRTDGYDHTDFQYLRGLTDDLEELSRSDI